MPVELYKIMTVKCEEPTGPVTREVNLVRDVDADYMRFLFSNLYGLPSMFDTGPLRDFEKLRMSLVNHDWTLLQVDDVGLLAVGPIRLDQMADVHVTFWDKRFRGRETLTRRVAEWAIKTHGLVAVFTSLPATARATIAFAKRVGFRPVGYKEGVTLDKHGQPDDALVMVFP